jgi:putative inorganic carbon (HCO3(-)) transporter
VRTVATKTDTPNHAAQAQLPDSAYDKIPLPMLLTFAAYIATWFLQLGSRISMLGAIRFEFLLAIALLVMALFMPRQQTKSTGLTPYVVMFFIAVLIEIPFSYNVDYWSSWIGW